MSSPAAPQHPMDGRRIPLAPAWLVALIAVCILAAIWLRFDTVSGKDVYRDEVWTSMHIAGTSIEDVRGMRDTATTAGALVARFQKPLRTSTALDTIRVLAETDPQHPPLYYLIARLWAKTVGSSVVFERLLSVLFGVLLLPAMYWLALLLFQSKAAAWLCAGLAATSPFQFVYAEQVREWALFSLLTVVATALLVRALQRGARLDWIAYAAAMIATEYCGLLSLGVIAAHAVAVFGLRVPMAARRRFLTSAGIAFVTYVPWLTDLALRWQRATSNAEYAALATPPKVYLAKLVFGLGTFVFDGEYASLRLAAVALLAILAAAYAIAVFAREAPAFSRWTVFSLALIPLAFFLCTDLALHASRALQERYLLATAVGVQLAAGYGLMMRPSDRPLKTALRDCAALFLLAAGLASIWISHRHAAWWDNNDAAAMASAAKTVRATPGAVVLFDDRFAALLFSNAANPNTKIAFDVPAAMSAGGPIYAFDVHKTMLARLRSAKGLRGQTIALAVPASAFQKRAPDVVLWKFSR